MIFLRPTWLLIAAALLLLALALRKKPATASWLQIMRPEIFEFLTQEKTPPSQLVNRCLLLASAIALALSGPALPREENAAYQNLEAWIIVMDLSRSMDAEDVRPSRLVASKEISSQILDAAASRSVALLGFSGDAYVLAPFTTDTEQTRSLFASINTETISDEGTRVDRALSLAASLLRDNGVIQGRIFLISDLSSVDDDSIALADRLKRSGQRLDVVLTATEQGGRVNDSPIFKADVSQARLLANTGGGKAFNVDLLGRPDKSFSDSLSARFTPDDLSLLSTGYAGWQDMSHWLLLAVAATVLVWFRRLAA